MDDVVLTLDTDWAPDCAIDWVARCLVQQGVRATWFVTHRSPAVERLRDHPDLFELGIHPNFLPGSSHGSTPDAVLEHCMQLVPDASSLRSHALVQSTPILARIMALTPITTDVSLFLPYTPFLRPLEYGVGDRQLLRVPYFWEDDVEMQQKKPCWRLGPLLDIGAGLKVFDFHPIHVYMNGADMGQYRELASRAGRLQDTCKSGFSGLVRPRVGTQSLFVELVEYLSARQSTWVRDLEAHWRVG